MDETLEQTNDSSSIGVLQLDSEKGTVVAENYINLIKSNIDNELNSLTSNSKFLFFPIRFDLKDNIPNIQITENLNEYFSYTNDTELKENVRLSTTKIKDIDLNARESMIDYIFSFVKQIIKIFDTTNLEIMLRAEPTYKKDNLCAKWHIDKTDEQINDFFYDEVKPNYPIKEKIIVPLFGEPTLFWNASLDQRADFLNSAEDKIFFYGFNKSCEINNIFSVKVNQEQVYSTPQKYGSIHLTGINGAIHSTPVSSEHGRIILLISIL